MTLPTWWTVYDTALLIMLVVFVIVAVALTWTANRASTRSRRRLNEAIRKATR